MKKLLIFTIFILGGIHPIFGQEKIEKSRLTTISTIPKGELISYPNPANDVVNIRVNDKVLKLEIMDMKGNILHAQHMPSDAKINVSKLSEGVYILAVKGFYKTYSKKLLITKNRQLIEP